MKRINAITRMIRPGLLILLLLPVLPVGSRPQEQTFDRWDPTDNGMKTGPAIGETIPDFEATDQNGRRIGFRDISGPAGALILFHRSADW